MKLLTYAASASAVAVLLSGSHGFDATKMHQVNQVKPKTATTKPAEKSAKAKQPTADKSADKEDKPKTVKVGQGDSLSKIAKRSGTTWQRLYNKNTNIKDPDLIHPGEKLVIPSRGEKLESRPLTTATPEPTEPSSSSSVSSNSVHQATPPSPAPTPAKRSQPARAPAPTSGSTWGRLAACESGGNWSINTGNGFYGGLQFTLSSWRAVGGTGLPSNASRSEQIMRAQKLQAIQGWGAWPVCSRKAGLR